jgi:hypothetical protein
MSQTCGIGDRSAKNGHGTDAETNKDAETKK